MSRRPWKVARRPAISGMSVVEVMVSLVLGLIIVGSAFTVFLSNRQTYRVAEALSRIQEASRYSFEVLARDLRTAGVNPCDANVPIYNALSNVDAVWWSVGNPADYGVTRGEDFVVGYGAATELPGIETGGDPGERLAGTDAVQLTYAQARGLVVAAHNVATQTLTLNTVDHGFANGDLALICDFEQGAIFQVSGASTGSALIRHTTSGDPGNARPNISSAAGSLYRYGCFKGLYNADGSCQDEEPEPGVIVPPRAWPAFVAELSAVRWYVVNNTRGSSSLIRESLQNIGGTLALTSTEVVDNVVGFNLQYLTGTGSSAAYRPADQVTDWANVSAMRISLTLESNEVVGDDGVSRARRSYLHTIDLRGRAL